VASAVLALTHNAETANALTLSAPKRRYVWVSNDGDLWLKARLPPYYRGGDVPNPPVSALVTLESGEQEWSSALSVWNHYDSSSSDPSVSPQEAASSSSSRPEALETRLDGPGYSLAKGEDYTLGTNVWVSNDGRVWLKARTVGVGPKPRVLAWENGVAGSTASVWNHYRVRGKDPPSDPSDSSAGGSTPPPARMEIPARRLEAAQRNAHDLAVSRYTAWHLARYEREKAEAAREANALETRKRQRTVEAEAEAEASARNARRLADAKKAAARPTPRVSAPAYK